MVVVMTVMSWLCDVVVVVTVMSWLCDVVVVAAVTSRSCDIVVVTWHGGSGSGHIVLCHCGGSCVVLQWLYGRQSWHIMAHY